MWGYFENFRFTEIKIATNEKKKQTNYTDN